MCGRMVLIKYVRFDGSIGYKRVWVGNDSVEDIERLKKVYFGNSLFDIRPTQIIDVFVIDPKSKRHKVEEMKWGWQPEWAKGKPILNTRKEGAESNRLWSKAVSENRCVIPVTHFYEWQKRDDSSKNVPWLIKRKDHSHMYFAGLFNLHIDEKNRKEYFEVSIFTESGNKLMKEIHNDGGNSGRQPVFIDEEKIPDWLDPDLKNPEEALMLLRHIEDGEYEAEILEEIGNDKTHAPPKPRQQGLF